jgi:hypothetical protein
MILSSAPEVIATLAQWFRRVEVNARHSGLRLIHWLPPEILEPIRRLLGVAHRMLDILVAEIGLQGPGIVALARQGEAAGSS